MDFFTDVGYWVFGVIFNIIDFIEPDDYSFALFLYRNMSAQVVFIVGLVFSLIVLFILIKIFKAFSGSTKQKKNRTRSIKPVPDSIYSARTTHSDKGSRKSKRAMYNISDNLEDKDRDWLATQYKEEERSRTTCIAGEIISPMKGQPMTAKDLKRSHQQDCDADNNYKEHLKSHRR